MKYEDLDIVENSYGNFFTKESVDKLLSEISDSGHKKICVVNLEVGLTQSEADLLKIICTTHKIDDEPINDDNRAYLLTKESVFDKLLVELDKKI